MIATRVAVAVLLLAVSVAAGACGYGLAGRGSASALPPHIRVISVPQFENRSSTPDVDQVITTAVQQEFASRGRFRTIPEATGGDAVLRGVITNVRTEPIAFDSSTQQVTRLAVVVTLNVEFVDLKEKDKIIWSRPGWQAREEYDISAGATVGDPAALFRQDSNALNRLARSLARSLVTSILDAF